MLVWINSITGAAQIDRPQRIRLADGTTRTAEAVTDEMLAEAEWNLHDVPEPDANIDLNTDSVDTGS